MAKQENINACDSFLIVCYWNITMKNIVTIGWWTWTYNLVSALKKLSNIFIHTVVSMSDDWGSTWFLRDEYWILPPGDLRRALVALADDEKLWFLRELFSYRFDSWLLKGQNLWNLIMLAAEKIAWDYAKALNELEKLFNITKWKVYPATLEKTRLLAKLENWDFIIWETNIDIPKHNPDLKIVDFWVIKEDYAKILKVMDKYSWNFIELQKVNKIFDLTVELAIQDKPWHNKKLEEIFEKADYIIIWPWDLYTSILLNILVWNVASLIKKSKAKKIYIANLFTKLGETNWYKLSDFLKIFEKYFGEDIFDYILVQDWSLVDLPENLIKRYKDEGKEVVSIDIKDFRLIKKDFVKVWEFVRHDIDKLYKVLKDLF